MARYTVPVTCLDRDGRFRVMRHTTLYMLCLWTEVAMSFDVL